MTTRQLVAANLRARMAWHKMRQPELAELMGWSYRTAQNKLHGLTGFTDGELARLAEVFGLADPGMLFRVPEGFAISVSESACTRLTLVAA